MRRTSHLIGLLLTLVLALVATACGGGDDGGDAVSSATEAAGQAASTATGTAGGDRPGEGKPPITIGTKDFTEQFILGELYAQALRDKGYTVNLKKNIGSSELIDRALTSKQIDMYPEYTGVVVATLAKSTEEPTSEDETYRIAKEFEEGRGYTMLEKTPFFDKDAVATTKALADEKGLKSIEDLKGAGPLTIGGRPEFKSRRQGLKGLQEVYGLTNLRFKQLSGGLNYQALDSGDVDVASVFTTDAALATQKYTVLDDPKGLFGYQNVAPILSREKLEEQGPEFEQIVNDVSSKLTNEAMVVMNAAVDVDKQNPEVVARTFLQANQLLGG